LLKGRTMRTSVADTKIPATTQAKAVHLPDEGLLARIALGLIVALAGGLRLAFLGDLGYANHYYAAAIQSMLQSWHNFFFLAAEPGGIVSVDKSPLGLWLQALSALIFGVNGFGLLLPEILAGLLSVALVYHLVQRVFGKPAGLAAALALAVTPVVVAVDRNNTIDSPLVLMLLLTAWAFIKATETERLRYLLLGAVLAGLAFNIKMLAAFLPLPAFYALYLLGAKASLWSKLGRLALASLALLAVSLAWVTAVQLTPASQRPYVGSSGDNSEFSLIVGYNGLNRLIGMRANLSRFVQNLFSGNPSGQPAGGQAGRGFPGNPGPGFSGGGGNFGGGFRGGFRGGFGGSFGGNPGGGGMLSALNTGRAGVFRLLQAPLSKELGWLLPFGLFGLLLAAVSTRLSWPLSQTHQALVLWGGWLLTGMAFFNVAGFYHPYYLAILGTPLAALVGTGAASLWRLGQRYPWPAIMLLVFCAAITLAFQAYTALSFIRTASWLLGSLALFTLGAAVLVSTANLPSRLGSGAGYGLVMASLMLAPTIWSGLTARYPSDNQSLPAAYDGYFKGPANSGGLQVDQKLIDYLQANTQGIEYLLAVPSSMQGSDYVLATGRPVLYMGGFDGNDAILTSQELAQMVSGGRLRYIYWNIHGSESINMSDVDRWVAGQCHVVPGFDTVTVNAGAPGGTTGGSLVPPGFARGFQISLYDCGS
jgi:4-amino-4-deoxy-L-arabinose transferase-like glycosyltransferase